MTRFGKIVAASKLLEEKLYLSFLSCFDKNVCFWRPFPLQWMQQISTICTDPLLIKGIELLIKGGVNASLSNSAFVTS